MLPCCWTRLDLQADLAVASALQIVDQSKLIQTLERFLEDYNSSSSKPMGLVFFQDAVDHIASIARVLRQPRGNALLVGVSGSGKQSLTRFAAALAGCACHQLELTKAYGLTEFREDLKVGSGSCIMSCMKLLLVFDLPCHIDARAKPVLQSSCGQS